MDKRFLRAFSDPASLTILGKRVFPFCLKHRVRLMALESPLVTGVTTILPADLMMAVKVCAEDGRLSFSWLEQVRIRELEFRPEKFASAVSRFVAHCHVDLWPKYWDGPKSTGTADGAGMPWPLMILTNLIAEGVDEQRAWEMPEVQAIWLSTAFSTRNGAKVNILTTEEEEMMEAIRRGELPTKQS